ncbi:MAG: hypothetical protein KIT02_14130 [Devosia sp.]|uniref:hypothetical protein n=1 Tax=Devosia sp. TaxID=1871048 RepID=UPI0024C9B91D|nr:hypothetical protein [Devosia sp.]UYN99052.1 MAG: hypothetical protein KIT02_14130 [Devosia sp.]
MTQADRHSLIRLVAGFVLWSLAFVLLYGVQALGCAYDWGMAHRPVLIGLYLAFIAAHVVVLRWPATRAEAVPALHQIGRWANMAALAAAVLVFLPVTFASMCV